MTALALEICRAQGMDRALNECGANNAAGEIPAGVSSGDDKGKEGPFEKNKWKKGKALKMLLIIFVLAAAGIGGYAA